MENVQLENLYKTYNELEEELKNTIGEEEKEDVKREMQMIQELIDECIYQLELDDEEIYDDRQEMYNEMRKTGEI